MYFTVGEIRNHLELGDNPSADVDRIIDRSIANAQAIVEGYLGGPLEETEFTQTVDFRDYCGPKFFLNHHPINSVTSITVDGGTPYDVSTYRVNLNTGVVRLDSWSGNVMEIVYTAGFPNPLPPDLEAVLLNITLALYTLGGSWSSSVSGTGALKSLTMFDAMSMSFDVGGDSSVNSGTSAMDMVENWKFVLNKYKLTGPAMA